MSTEHKEESVKISKYESLSLGISNPIAGHLSDYPRFSKFMAHTNYENSQGLLLDIVELITKGSDLPLVIEVHKYRINKGRIIQRVIIGNNPNYIMFDYGDGASVFSSEIDICTNLCTIMENALILLG